MISSESGKDRRTEVSPRRLLARRKFVEAVKVNPKDAAAHNMVVRMDALFLVDRLARETQLSVEARLAT